MDPSLILRSTSRVFRLLLMLTDVVHCTTTEIDCNWQQPRGEGIIASLSVSFSISLLTEHTKKGKITNGTRTSSHRVPFSRRTGPPFWHGFWQSPIFFWAKLNQVLVDAGADLYAKETKAKISTPQDTLDARHDMTKAKLDVMRLPPRRLPKNQMRDSDVPSDIEKMRHIFTGWRTYSTYWRSTATTRRLQRRDKTKKHTEQAQRISDAWDQRDFRTLWSAARAMLSQFCGPKRRRYVIPLSSLPTAAAWTTHLRQAGPLGWMSREESGLGSTALGSEESRTTGGALGRSGRTGGARGGFS